MNRAIFCGYSGFIFLSLKIVPGRNVSNVDFHCKRLIFALHSTRYQILSKLETRKR